MSQEKLTVAILLSQNSPSEEYFPNDENFKNQETSPRKKVLTMFII